jgi:hypothetical protein
MVEKEQVCVAQTRTSKYEALSCREGGVGGGIRHTVSWKLPTVERASERLGRSRRCLGGILWRLKSELESLSKVWLTRSLAQASTEPIPLQKCPFTSCCLQHYSLSAMSHPPFHHHTPAQDCQMAYTFTIIPYLEILLGRPMSWKFGYVTFGKPRSGKFW